MKRYIAALDQGTTSSRCILFDQEQNIIGSAQRELTQIYPKPGWVEQDPMEIWSTQYSVLTEVLAQTGVSPEELAAIGITMGQIRLSSGLEDTDDLLNDFDQALAKL